MQAILRRGNAAPLPRPSREFAGSPIAARWRRIAKRLYKLANPPSSSPRELPPELFRYPLP
jgi:hypothetical protein